MDIVFGAVLGFAAGAGLVWVLRRPAAPARLPEHDVLRRETMALIARTLGHDFGNMIAAMGMSLSLARLKMERKHEGVKQALDDAEMACDRATKLAKQMIAFARTEDSAKHITALHVLLQVVAQVCTRNANAPIEVSTDPGLSQVECDESQLALVFHALIMTAVNGNGNGRHVPVVADNWRDPSSGEHFVRICVQHGVATGSSSPPAFGLVQAQPMIAAHRGRLLREHDSSGNKLILLLPSAGQIG